MNPQFNLLDWYLRDSNTISVKVQLYKRNTKKLPSQHRVLAYPKNKFKFSIKFSIIENKIGVTIYFCNLMHPWFEKCIPRLISMDESLPPLYNALNVILGIL